MKYEDIEILSSFLSELKAKKTPTPNQPFPLPNLIPKGMPAYEDEECV